MRSAMSMASAGSVVAAPCGCGISSLLIISSNVLRFSAASMLDTDVPRMAMPRRSSGVARLIAVCPPNCTTAPTARSSAITAATASSSSGSKYRRVLQSKSVLTVSGLLLTITDATCDARSDSAACTLQ